MHEPTGRLDTSHLRGTHVAGTGSIEWRSTDGDVVAVTNVAPRGRKGLWDAMARAAADRPEATVAASAAVLAIDPEPEPAFADPGPDLDLVVDVRDEHRPVTYAPEDAHVAYLARVARSGARPSQGASPRHLASVVDLDEFRRRHGRRL